MEKRFIIVYTYLNNDSSVESIISDALTYDEMIGEYMTSFFERNSSDVLRNMSCTEITNRVISWEESIYNSQISPVKVYEINMVKHVLGFIEFIEKQS